MKILVTRPAEDGAETARQLTALGHQPLLAPLLTVHFESGPELELAATQAVLLTSANGARALARRTRSRALPVFAVGAGTAESAKTLGFLRVQSADGDAAALAELVARQADPKAGKLLHAAGMGAGKSLAEALAAHGFSIRQEILYRVEVADHLLPEAALALGKSEIGAALFYSPASARAFVQCVARDGLPVEKLIALCISADTATALSDLRFAEIRIAPAPNQAALLACL